MTRKKYKETLYVGEEDTPRARRLVRFDSHLTPANAHKHLCDTCQREFYCWCWKPVRDDGPCMDCFHEASLPKVVIEGEKGGKYRTSKLFSHIQVSEGGWTNRWVTTRELRVALTRWISQEYKACPPETSTEAGSYQCGGCRFFLALDSDYGICASPDSPYDGRIVFEHIGCKANPWYIKNHEALPA